MAKKRRGSVRVPPPRKRTFPVRSLLLGVVLLGAAGALAVAVLGGGQSVGGVTAWATLRTPDVHSLAFDPADPQHLFFGHHGGLLETKDGGRSWQPTALRGADAMNVAPSAGGFFQIAGHDV